MIGRTLDHYRIESKLGEGGMGVVYKAQDTHLARMVAIKILPADKLTDPSRKQRFVQEARAASALNHPNIITIHDIRSCDSVDFIVMEYVVGKTLAELIPAKGMPAADALRYAVQIADALAKAHDAGILHRDIKPANIMVTAEDRIKILDFGLAKLFDRVDSGQDAPTATMRELTEDGALVGTVAYMSPEQAEGRKVDARSDIFSFGAVLYQMVTGQKPFQADSQVGLLAKILTAEPQPPSQIATLPPELEKLILRCLRKDPSRRYQTMADLKVALEDLQVETPSNRSPGIRRVAFFAAVILAAVAAIWLASRVFQRPLETRSARTVKFTFIPHRLRRGANFNVDSEVSISPDGKHITYVEAEGGQLWMRDIDQEQAHIVPGATRVYQVFWSPDSQYIGYAAGLDLVKIPLQGGTPALIGKLAGLFRRASWSSDGETILYCDSTGMYTIPAKGGSPTRIVEHSHIEHPSFLDLPDGRRAFLYQAVDGSPKHGIYVQRADETQRRLLTLSSSSNPYPVYSPSGHIVYVDGTGDSVAIWALPFSLATLQATGKAFPIAEHGSSPAMSRTGTLVYGDVPPDRQQLVWCDRSGRQLSAVGELQRLQGAALSPDGHRLAAIINENNDVDLWIYDLDRGIKTRFTFDSFPKADLAWSPSGEELAYSANRSGTFDIFSKPSNGNGEARLVAGTPLPEFFPEWSPDQKFLMYTAVARETKSDLLYRERRNDGSYGDPVVFLKTPFDETAARFSPDGRLVAYMSNESGRYEVYVRSFPDNARKWQISANGGMGPRWRRDGKELFYVEQRKLMAVPLKTQPAFSAGSPAALFEQPALLSLAGYDVSGDGKRFIARERPGNEPPLAIHVVHNWFEEFRGRNAAGSP